MNRAERRRQRRRSPSPLVQAYAAAYRCPDCIAETRLEQHGPGLYRLVVAHDDTCPTFRQMEDR